MSSGPHHHPAGHLPPPRVEEVGDGLFAYIQPDGSWWINNTGFVVGRREVLSVDACATEARTRAYLDAIAGVTPRAVRVLVNTHFHGDHTFGNGLFTEAAIVGHHLARDAMLASPTPPFPFWEPVDWGTIELTPPWVTFHEGIDIWVDDVRLEVRYAHSPAHTTGDSVVWVPDQRVLYAGDLVFNGGTPFLLAGSISGTRTALAYLRSLDAATIVPGHGDVCGPEVIDRVLAYVDLVETTARQAKAAGLAPLEAARETDLGPFADLLDPERIVGNLHRAYAELDGREPGCPLDLVQPLTDMVAYNGGQPLSCYA